MDFWLGLGVVLGILTLLLISWGLVFWAAYMKGRETGIQMGLSSNIGKVYEVHESREGVLSPDANFRLERQHQYDLENDGRPPT